MGIFDSIDKKIEARDEGIRVSDLLDLPASLRKLMNRAIRDKELTVEAAAKHINESPDQARQFLDLLVDKGYLQREKHGRKDVYKVYLGRTHPKEVSGSLWGVLDKKIED